MHLSQGRHLDGIIDDEGRLDERTLAEFTEYLVNQFALTHRIVNLKVQLLAHVANLVFSLAFQVVTCLLLDGLKDGQTAVGGLETDDLTVDLGLGLAVDSDTDGFQQVLGKRHHPVIILVLDIELHTGKFGVMVAVHTLVTEVLSDFINALKTAHNQALEIQLGSNAHVHRNVQRIEVSNEWSCCSSAGNSLQSRGLDLGVTRVVKHLSHGLDYLSAFQEGFLHTRIDHEVNITLTVAQLRILKRVIGHAVLHLDYGQRFQRLAQQLQGLRMDADFARLGTEHVAMNTDEVTHVEQFLEHGVIQFLVLAWAQIVTTHINLHTALGIL